MIARFSRQNSFHLTGMRRMTLDQARGRLVLLSAAFVLCYIVIAARVVDLTIIQGELRTKETSMQVEPAPVPSVRRGDIVDRNGVLLARSLKTASLYADPALIGDAKIVARDLSKLFPELSYGDLLQKLQSEKRFVWIKRNLAPEEQHEILYMGNPGLNFTEEDRRLYPQGELGAHLVGYASIDGQGLAGVEGSFNKLLREGEAPLTLTLDVRLQHALRREMKSAYRLYQAKGAAGVVMDVTNGEVLAAVSLPDFDPNNFDAASDNALFNRVSLGVYELGSTFKIFSTAAYLETQKTSLGKTFDAREPIKVGRFTIRDFHPEKRVLSIPEVFMYSSNIGAAQMAEAVGTKAMKDFYDDLGLLRASPLEVGEIGAPLVPKPWRDVNTLTASFGHGIAVSPVQLVSAAASIVNGGYSISPTLILDKNGHGKAANEARVRVVSPQTAHRMRQLMRLVVQQGTGGQADVPGYHVGGKTGTAEKISTGGYDEDKRISSFLGVFPMEAPRYAVYVMLDEPRGTQESQNQATGGWVAAPVTGKVISAMASILGLPPSKSADDLADSLTPFIKTKEQIEQERQLAAH